MSGMRVGDIAPQIALVVGAVTVLLVALVVPRRLQWVGAPVAGLALAVSGVLTVVVPLQAGQRLTMDGLWAVDGTTTAAGLLIILTTALTIGLSPEWLGDDPRYGEFYAVLLLSAVGAIAMAGAADTLQLAVGMLLSSVTGYTLVAYHRRSPLSVEAGIKYFLVGAFANTLFVLGVTLAFGLAATTLYEPASAALTTADGTVLALATGLLGLGLAFKLGAVPLPTSGCLTSPRARPRRQPPSSPSLPRSVPPWPSPACSPRCQRISSDGVPSPLPSPPAR